MGLTVIPTPGATPLHLDVRVSASTDAATKGYVDVADAADRAYAHSVATAAVRLGAAAAVVQSGSVATTHHRLPGFRFGWERV